MQVLIDAIAHQLPKSEAELALFRRTLEPHCRLLETRLRNCGFLATAEEEEEEDGSDDDEEGGEHKSRMNKDKSKPLHQQPNQQQHHHAAGPLSDYIADLPTIFADLRRREILSAARELVLSDYHNTMLAAGDAAEDELASAGDIGDARAALEQSVSFAMQKLKFDSCQTSLAACRLLKLVHEVMRQASSTSSSCGGSGGNSAANAATGTTIAPSPSSSASASAQQVSHALFQAARDCLELFMAIVPMQFADVIVTVPRMGAVFYNDCLYIAHNCTLISHAYRHEMGRNVSEILQHTVGFADFIPRLRSLGDSVLVRHIEEQKKTLAELVRRIHISPAGDSDGGGSGSGNTSTKRAAAIAATGAPAAAGCFGADWR